MNTNRPLRTLLIVHSYHHHNTLKIADAFSKILNASIKAPNEIDKNDLGNYDLIGFGSGIDSGKHYPPLIALAHELHKENQKYGFIFSTSAVQGKLKVAKDHETLRSILVDKGYIILDEFSCKGFNTNSFLKYFGGMNKDKPDINDIENAEVFANKLSQKLQAATSSIIK